jgi:hypothetical protein
LPPASFGILELVPVDEVSNARFLPFQKLDQLRRRRFARCFDDPLREHGAGGTRQDDIPRNHFVAFDRHRRRLRAESHGARDYDMLASWDIVQPESA